MFQCHRLTLTNGTGLRRSPLISSKSSEDIRGAFSSLLVVEVMVIVIVMKRVVLVMTAMQEAGGGVRGPEGGGFVC